MNPKSPEYKLTQLKAMSDYAAKYNGKCLATEYLNSHAKYLWEDSEGNQWYACWYNYKQRGGWSKKAGYEKNAKGLIKYSCYQINEKFAKPKGGRLLSTSYKNTKSLLEWEDSKGRKFSMDLNNVISGQWSPHEKKERLGELKRKHDWYFCRDYANRNGGELLTNYTDRITSQTVLNWKDKDGNIFERKWGAVVKSGTLLCQKKSLGEYQISEFLKFHNIDFIPHDRKTLGTGFELDFYIPSKKLAIEYHGLRWHTSDKLGRNYHSKKLEMCKVRGIQLLQIWEYEWKDRQEQVKSFVVSKLGLNQVKIAARKTILMEVPKSEAREFLNKYHIQGAGKFSVAFGLYFNNELQMLVAIGRHHRTGQPNVLTRCVSKVGTTVVGGLSKLCKHAVSIYGEIITWVDLRWSEGQGWINNGWKLEQQLQPDYFYYNSDTKQIVSKQSRKKSNVNTPSHMTEREHAKADGLEQVFDAGKLRLRLSYFQ